MQIFTHEKIPELLKQGWLPVEIAIMQELKKDGIDTELPEWKKIEQVIKE